MHIRPALYPEVFGPPFDKHHPWAEPHSRHGWGLQRPRVHLVDVANTSCTECRRGTQRCGPQPFRITTNTLRVTCCQCIRASLDRYISRDLGRRGPAAISWWRATAWSARHVNDVPDILRRFFEAVDPLESLRASEDA